jgi:hypothetical protein
VACQGARVTHLVRAIWRVGLIPTLFQSCRRCYSTYRCTLGCITRQSLARRDASRKVNRYQFRWHQTGVIPEGLPRCYLLEWHRGTRRRTPALHTQTRRRQGSPSLHSLLSRLIVEMTGIFEGSPMTRVFICDGMLSAQLRRPMNNRLSNSRMSLCGEVESVPMQRDSL